MAPQLAWIDLGNMGRVHLPLHLPRSVTEQSIRHVQKPRRERQLDKPLIISNRTAKRAEDFSKIGYSTVASSIDETVAKSDIIFLCLADDTSINENVEKILKGMSRAS
jgi:glutamyl-tRNA reductase